MILAELAKKDAQWRKMAFQICKDKDLADELVQEMYLKLYENTNLIKDGYIYTVLRNLFYDYTKTQKDIIVDFNYIDSNPHAYIDSSPNDYLDAGAKYAAFYKSMAQWVETIAVEEDYIEPIDYKALIKGLTWYERTMFELSTLVGQRELSRQTGIHIQTIHRINKMVKSKIYGKKKD